MADGILILDNNCLNRLERAESRKALYSNLRCVGRQFWPTVMNIAEAMTARDEETRVTLLKTLRNLAGEKHVIVRPTEVLRKIAEAQVTGAASIDFSEPGATYFLREPDVMTKEDIDSMRVYLEEEEKSFRAIHETAKSELKESISEAGGPAGWSTMGDFLDELWSTPDHLGAYVEAIWSGWGFPDSAPVDALLAHPAWKIYFDGWGAAFWNKTIAHPQPRWTGTADLKQLVYLGITPDALLATDDIGLQAAGSGILRCRYPMRTVVTGDAVLC